MNKIQFSKDQKDEIVHKLETHFNEELYQDTGRLEVEFPIGFFAGDAGEKSYNRGLFDAQLLINEKMEVLSYLTQALGKLEKQQ